MEEKAKKVLSRLEAQCARREYCSSDMLAKATKALDGDCDAAAGIMASLEKDGFVSDSRYASAFAREKSCLAGWGPVKIRFALRAKKIPEELIGAALGEVDADKAGARLENLMRARWKILEGNPHARLKLLKFALGRGYGYDEVQKMADKITGNG